jgi:hypothetical protein
MTITHPVHCACGAIFLPAERWCPDCGTPAWDPAFDDDVVEVRAPAAPVPAAEQPEPQVRPARKTLNVRWVDETIGSPPPEPPVLIDGLMRAGELVALVAPRKLGKSWVSMQTAVLLARGEGKLFGQLEVRRRCRVLLAQGELDEWGPWSRWTYLTGDQGGAPAGIGESFDRWRIRVEEIQTRQHDPETGLSWTARHHEAKIDPALEEAIVEHSIDVLIIDPWAVFYAGSENSNDEVEAALSRLREISMRTGVAVVVVHHISKVLEVRDPEDMWRGASRLADWASTGITMLPHYKKEADWKRAGFTRQQARRWADLHFMRRGAPVEDFSIRWEPTTGWWEKGDPPAAGEGPANQSPYTADPEAVAVLLVGQGGEWSSVGAAKKAMGISSHSVAEKALEAAVARGLIEEFKAPRGARGFRARSVARTLRLVADRHTDEDAPDGVHDGEDY